MKKWVALLMALTLVMSLFAACGNKIAEIDISDDEEEETEESEETETTEETENVTEDTTVPEETENNGVKVYAVTVVDQDGNPLEGVMVQFCDENGCMPAMTDEEGKAQCQTLNEKTVKIMEMPEGYGYATSQEEWDFTEGDEVTIVLKKLDGGKPNTQGGGRPNTQGGGNQGGGNSATTEPELDMDIPEEPTEPTEDFEVDFGDLT